MGIFSTNDFLKTLGRSPNYRDFIRAKVKVAIMNTDFKSIKDEETLDENLDIFFSELEREYKEAWMMDFLKSIPTDMMKEN